MVLAIFRKDGGGIRNGDGILIVGKSYILACKRRDPEPRNSEILVCEFCTSNRLKIIFCAAYRPLTCSLFIACL